MKCNDVMNRNLQWIGSNASVGDAARMMRDNAIGFLVVFGPSAGQLAGVVTDRDLAIRCCAENRRPDETKVADVATKDVIVCGYDDDLKTAEKTMRQTEKSRLVIVDEVGRPVGVLSLTDIIRRDRPGRALDTARAVLAREAEGAHTPIERIALTPSTPEDEDRAMRQETATHGGSWGGSMKEFP